MDVRHDRPVRAVARHDLAGEIAGVRRVGVLDDRNADAVALVAVSAGPVRPNRHPGGGHERPPPLLEPQAQDLRPLGQRGHAVARQVEEDERRRRAGVRDRCLRARSPDPRALQPPRRTPHGAPPKARRATHAPARGSWGSGDRQATRPPGAPAPRRLRRRIRPRRARSRHAGACVGARTRTAATSEASAFRSSTGSAAWAAARASSSTSTDPVVPSARRYELWTAPERRSRNLPAHMPGSAVTSMSSMSWKSSGLPPSRRLSSWRASAIGSAASAVGAGRSPASSSTATDVATFARAGARLSAT